MLTDPLFLALKAALAASVAVLLTRLFHVSDQLSAGFVAVACVSPTAYAGLKRGAQHAFGSALGGGIATALTLILPAPLAPAIVLVSVFLAVLACMRLKMASAYGVAAFSAVYVVALPFVSATIAVETRLASVAIGIGVATITNLGVSAIFGERIIERRMRLARERIADALADRKGDAADARFETAFTLVAELRTDLEAAQRELLGSSFGARRAAARHIAEAIRFRRLLHVTKTLVLVGRSTIAARAIHDAVASLRRGSLHEAEVDALFAHLGSPDSSPRRL
ncbi:hypothetical protein BH09MYX1_BH09MYX1_40120 [soil metagenome]